MRLFLKLTVCSAILISTGLAKAQTTDTFVRTPYVEEHNKNFSALEEAYKNKDAQTIERILVHLSAKAKSDNNLRDLSRSYVELTDYFIARGMYEKAEYYFDLSIPLLASLADTPDQFNQYLWQISEAAEMFERKGEAKSGINLIKKELPKIEALLQKFKESGLLDETFRSYSDLFKKCIELTLTTDSSSDLKNLLLNQLPVQKTLLQNLPHALQYKLLGINIFMLYDLYKNPELNDYLKYTLEVSKAKNGNVSSSNNGAVRTLAEAYRQQGNYSKAINVYKEVVFDRVRPDDESSSMYDLELGRLFQENNDPENAAIAFSKGLEKHTVFEKSVETGKNNSNQHYLYSLYRLGTNFVQTGQEDKYQQLFSQSTSKWKNNPDSLIYVYIHHAKIEYERKNYVQAEKIALVGLKTALNPKNGNNAQNTLRLLLVEIYTAQKYIDKANKTYLEFFKANANNDSSFYYDYELPKFIIWAAEQGRIEEALKLSEYRLAYRQDGDLVEVETRQKSMVIPLTILFKKSGEKNPLEKTHDFINSRGVWMH